MYCLHRFLSANWPKFRLENNFCVWNLWVRVWWWTLVVSRPPLNATVIGERSPCQKCYFQEFYILRLAYFLTLYMYQLALLLCKYADVLPRVVMWHLVQTELTSLRVTASCESASCKYVSTCEVQVCKSLSQSWLGASLESHWQVCLLQGQVALLVILVFLHMVVLSLPLFFLGH